MLKLARRHLAFALAVEPGSPALPSWVSLVCHPRTRCGRIWTRSQEPRRAATLTNQLLTFARKQTAAPRTLNLNALILDMDKLLRRLSGAQIVLSTEPDPEPAWIYADASQIEQVLVNLLINARRDA